MPKSTTKSAVLRESWRPAGPSDEAARRRLLAIRLLFCGLLLGLAASFLYLLFAPFYHPTTRQFFVTAKAAQLLEAPVIPFFQEDAFRFLAADGSFEPTVEQQNFFLLESPQRFREIVAQIDARQQHQSDVAIIYLAAQPYQLDGAYFLQCENLDRGNPRQGLVSLEELVGQMATISAGTVVLALDPGQGSPNFLAQGEAAGIGRALEQAVRSRGASNLWVVLSHSAGQQAYRSAELRGSAFCHAVSRALEGHADANRDRQIDMAEFQRFVSHYTQTLVQQLSDSLAVQTPQLLFSSDAQKKRAAVTVIAPVPPRNWQAVLASSIAERQASDPAEAGGPTAEQVAAQQQTETSQNWLSGYVAEKSTRIKERSIEELEDNINYLPSFLAKRVKRVVGLDNAAEEDTPAAPVSEAGLPPSEVSAGPGSSADSAPAAAGAVAEAEVPIAESPEVLADRGVGSMGGEAQPPLPPLPDLSKLAVEDVRRHELLQLAWSYCDYLEQPDGRLTVRGVDVAPHAWTAVVSHMFRLEERERLGNVLDPQDQRVTLTAEVLGGYQFASSGQARVGRTLIRLSEQVPRLQLPDVPLASLGQAEQLSGWGGLTLDPLVRQATTRLDAAVRADQREPLERWLSELPPGWANQYVECFWVDQLLQRGGIPWPVVQQALQLVRRYEQLSHAPCATNAEVQVELDLANRLRLQGTRMALDQLGPQWVELSSRQLELSAQGLARAAAAIANLRAAVQLRNDLLLELQPLLAWRQICVQRLGQRGLDDDLESLLANLRRLCEVLLLREQATQVEVRQLVGQLRASRQRMKQLWMDEAQRLLAGSDAPAASDAWRLDALLATWLVRGPERQRLLGLTLDNPATSPLAPEAKLDLASAVLSISVLEDDPRQLRFAQQAAELLALVQPPAHGSPSTADQAPPSPKAETAAAIQDAYRALPMQIQQIVDAVSAASTSAAAAAAMPADDRIVLLRRAELGLRLLVPSDAFEFDGRELMSALHREELGLMIGRQLADFRNTVADALPQEAIFVRGASSRMSRLGRALSDRNPGEAVPPPSVAAVGPRSLSLISDPQLSGQLRWSNLGAPLAPVWLLVEFDERLLDIELEAAVPCYEAARVPEALNHALEQAQIAHVAALTSGDAAAAAVAAADASGAAAEQQLRQLRERLLYPPRVAPGELAPSGSLPAGQQLEINFRLRRKASGPATTKVIWRLIGNQVYQRHEMMVQLPVSERLQLIAEGGEDRWSPTVDGISLHPWPNRTSQFRLGIVGSPGAPAAVQVEVFSLQTRQEYELPSGFITADAAGEVLLRLGPATTVARLERVNVPASGDPLWLPLEDVLSPTAATGAGSVTEPAAVDAQSAGSGGEARPAAADPLAAIVRSIRHGLVLKMTDVATGHSLWRRIDFRVRHPSSYVEVAAGFDALAERLRIVARSSRPDDLPAGGIPLRARIVEQLPRGTALRLEGVITEPGAVELYAQVPAAAPRELTVELDVDGFRRAFVFQVPCWRAMLPEPVTSQRQRVAIVSPAAGTSLGPDATETEVHLQVDAPRGAFVAPQDVVEVGWDLDRDREFADESPVRIAADRQVEVGLLAIHGGGLTVHTDVSDLTVRLPRPAVSNTRVNLLARVTAVGETTWSGPHEIIVDSSPPQITGVELLPGAAFSQDMDLTVRVGADDALLSGVQRVEVGISTSGTGQFEVGDKPLAAELSADGGWVAQIPGKALTPGGALLLVRAVDHAGNVSPVSKLAVEIFSPEQWAANQAAAVQEVSGVVMYAGTELANAQVTLQNDEGEVLHQTTTDDRGYFQFPQVKVGKYALLAVGVAKNRPRRAEQALEVLAPPAAPRRLQLLAK